MNRILIHRGCNSRFAGAPEQLFGERAVCPERIDQCQFIPGRFDPIADRRSCCERNHLLRQMLRIDSEGLVGAVRERQSICCCQHCKDENHGAALHFFPSRANLLKPKRRHKQAWNRTGLHLSPSVQRSVRTRVAMHIIVDEKNDRSVTG